MFSVVYQHGPWPTTCKALFDHAFCQPFDLKSFILDRLDRLRQELQAGAAPVVASHARLSARTLPAKRMPEHARLVGRIDFCVVHCVGDVVPEAMITKLVTFQAEPDQPLAEFLAEVSAELPAFALARHEPGEELSALRQGCDVVQKSNADKLQMDRNLADGWRPVSAAHRGRWP